VWHFCRANGRTYPDEAGASFPTQTAMRRPPAWQRYVMLLAIGGMGKQAESNWSAVRYRCKYVIKGGLGPKGKVQ
jgi:hypothetical protein